MFGLGNNLRSDRGPINLQFLVRIIELHFSLFSVRSAWLILRTDV